MSNFRQQQELQEEQERDIMQLLLRVQDRCGQEIALRIASHLGYLNQYRQLTSERKVA